MHQFQACIAQALTVYLLPCSRLLLPNAKRRVPPPCLAQLLHASGTRDLQSASYALWLM